MLSVCEQINYPIAQPSAEMVCYARMQTILYFHHGDDYASRLRLEGINAFARTLDWNVQCYEELVSARTLKTLREFWHPVGAILCPNNRREEFDASLFSPDSTVLLDCFPPDGLETFASIITDSFPATENVARELLAAKCRSYGFVPWHTTRIWSENRRHNLSRILARHGIRMHEFAPSEEGLNARRLQEELIPWLRDLPKPCGIWAACDARAKQVLDTCRLAKIDVPDQIQVLGVDDDNYICELTLPSLSSIAPDFEAGGFAAAEFLYGILTGSKVATRTVLKFSLKGAVERLSTADVNGTARRVTAAREYIRKHATAGISVPDVAASLGVSTRLLEKNYRAVTGRTVLADIQAMRLEKVKDMLRKTTMPIDNIGPFCGFNSPSHLKTLFRSTFGMTMSDYRRS